MDIKVQNYTEIIKIDVMFFLIRMANKDKEYNSSHPLNNLKDNANDIIKKNHYNKEDTNSIVEKMTKIQGFFDAVYDEINISDTIINKYFGEITNPNVTAATIILFYLKDFEYKHGYINDTAIYTSICSVISRYEEDDMLEENNEKIINDYNEFINYLNLAKISDDCKWKFLQIVTHFEQYQKDINQIINDVTTIYQKNIYLIEDIIDESMNQVQEIVSRISKDEMVEYFHIGLNDTKKPIIALCVSTVNSIGIIDIANESILFVGILFNFLEDKKSENNIEDVYSTIKNLGEKRKFEILRILDEQPCNGLQLATKLGITPATISHHMKQLVQTGMVGIEYGEKSMYTIRNKSIVDDLILIKTIIEN